MNKTDEILERLKGRQPMVADADDLTERIMASLPDMADSKAGAPVRTLVRTLRLVSTAAAVWLIGLFLYQKSYSAEEQIETKTNYYTTDFSYGATLKNVYTGRQKRNQTSFYSQIKEMYYEKK